MDIHDSEGFLPNSPSLGMHDPFYLEYLAQVPAKSIEREAECAPGRHDHEHEHEDLPNGSTEFSNEWTMSSTQEFPAEEPPVADSERDPTEWYLHYTACLQHFLDHAQHSESAQSLAAFINIRLPCQWPSDPITHFTSQPVTDPASGREMHLATSSSFVSLRTYIRRLIVTGQDTPSALHVLFGDDWVAGVDFLWKQERMNYLFTAKSSGWASTKTTYDILPDEQTPALRPLREPSEEELRSAEARWSEWLAMEDWMVGPRSPW